MPTFILFECGPCHPYDFIFCQPNSSFESSLTLGLWSPKSYLWSLRALVFHMLYIETWRQNTHTYKFKKENEMKLNEMTDVTMLRLITGWGLSVFNLERMAVPCMFFWIYVNSGYKPFMQLFSKMSPNCFLSASYSWLPWIPSYYKNLVTMVVMSSQAHILVKQLIRL